MATWGQLRKKLEFNNDVFSIKLTMRSFSFFSQGRVILEKGTTTEKVFPLNWPLGKAGCGVSYRLITDVGGPSTLLLMLYLGRWSWEVYVSLT